MAADPAIVLSAERLRVLLPVWGEDVALQPGEAPLPAASPGDEAIDGWLAASAGPDELGLARELAAVGRERRAREFSAAEWALRSRPTACRALVRAASSRELLGVLGGELADLGEWWP